MEPLDLDYIATLPRVCKRADVRRGIERSILHIDMNNFYASVECMLNPELKGKYVAVCGSPDDRHGIVLAKNEAAKACGVKTGEAIWQARLKCPNLVTVPPQHGVYGKYSVLARQIYSRYTDMIEPFGLDECWVDITGSLRLFGTPEKIAEEIRCAVKSELGLTVSIGVSFNKVFAKLGSDLKKPDAVTVISRENFKEKIWSLPVGEMLGVGPKGAKALAKFGIRTIGQLAEAPEDFLIGKFGKNGAVMKKYAMGEDRAPVAREDEDAPPKSVGHGHTTSADLKINEEVNTLIIALSQDIGKRLSRAGMKARGVSVSVRDCDLATKEWQCRMSVPTASPTYISREAYALFCRSYSWEKPIRSVTVCAIDLFSGDDPWQMGLEGDENVAKREKLDAAIENLRDKFGHSALQNACLVSPAEELGDDCPF